MERWKTGNTNFSFDPRRFDPRRLDPRRLDPRRLVSKLYIDQD